MRHRAHGRPVRGLSGPGSIADMSDPLLVTIEARIRTTDDPGQLGDRIRESIAMIAGREALEEFRVLTMPLDERKRPRS